MKVIVAVRIFWFSSSLSFSSPYKSKCTNLVSERKVILLTLSIGFTTPKRVFLWLIKLGQRSKKWQVVSASREQLQVSWGVSRKWCDFLWLFKGLRPTRSWKIHLMPLSCMLYKLFFTGRYNFRSCRLKTDIDSAPHNSGPRSFHIDTLSGKKLLRYLSVLHAISFRTLLWRNP